ncbi:unnamed protein product [Effrenium voratum]|nr:unnamed protein product [Effrenium voratum]
MAGDEAVRVGAMDSEGKVMEHSTQALEDQLQETVMAKLEDILVKHENDLWRRGQEAIAQLQPDRKKVMSCLQELQTRQAELMAQQEEMSRELLGISSKLDWFVGECTQAMSGLGSSEPLDIRDVYAGTEGVPNGFDDILVDSSVLGFASGAVAACHPHTPALFIARLPFCPLPFDLLNKSFSTGDKFCRSDHSG